MTHEEWREQVLQAVTLAGKGDTTRLDLLADMLVHAQRLTAEIDELERDMQRKAQRP